MSCLENMPLAFWGKIEKNGGEGGGLGGDGDGGGGEWGLRNRGFGERRGARETEKAIYFLKSFLLTLWIAG